MLIFVIYGTKSAIPVMNETKSEMGLTYGTKKYYFLKDSTIGTNYIHLVT